MADVLPDDLWRDFPKTAPAFEARFKTEQDCRAYWIRARWGGKPACAKCGGTRMWPIRGGIRCECAACGHQTSLTSGTVLENDALDPTEICGVKGGRVHKLARDREIVHGMLDEVIGLHKADSYLTATGTCREKRESRAGCSVT